MTDSAANLAKTRGPIVFIKVDTFGDLVLFAPTLNTIRNAWPTRRLIVLLRQAYADIAPHLASGIEWITTTIDPFGRGPSEEAEEFARLRKILSEIQPEAVVAATSRRTWVEIGLAATSGASQRMALGSDAHDEFFATQLRLMVGVDASAAFNEHLPIEPTEPDWQRNLRLAEALLGKTLPRVPAQLKLVPATDGAADRVLRERQLESYRFAVCAAAGFANVALKTWPADRFATVIRHLHVNHGVRTLLIGAESERTHLEGVAAYSGAVVWVGTTGDLPLLVQLLEKAALFVGNDTGAMHLAAALGVPTVGVFGGGTWPRFIPAGQRVVSVVQPLPCFGCGWDCAFGDAPCLGGIEAADVESAIDFAWANREREFAEVRNVTRLDPDVRNMMGKAAVRYRELRDAHLARQHKLEELTALDREKDQEISAIKAVCDDRERVIIRLDGGLRALQSHTAALESDKALLEKTLQEMPRDEAKAARALTDQAIHIRNIDALLRMREHELTEIKASMANRAAGLHDLEQAKHYGRLLAEKETVIRTLRRGCEEREAVIRQLSAKTTGMSATLHKLWAALRGFVREKISRPLDAWMFSWAVERYWMQIGVLLHYAPRPLKWDERLPAPRLSDAKLPQVAIVTPSYGQERFVERTILSVLEQHYPKLRYVVQDGGSKDRSPEIIARHATRLHHWESVKDQGQADAIGRGFAHVASSLRPDDIMAWLNSDDLFGPGVLRFVGEYFIRHPETDVVYGHRIIIDDDDCDVGRWIMPRHDAPALEWIDYIPQETLFWRKRAWDLIGGIDPTFQFALDWDLLARFHQAGCKIVRVPYFLGAFRVHAEQKTSKAIHTTGAEEMRRIRTRFHGERQDDPEMIERYARKTRFRGALTSRLHEVGIRW